MLLGATKGMGRALSRVLSARGDLLFLLGRDEEDLAKTQADCAVTGSEPVGFALCDLEDPTGFDAALGAADLALGGFDTVIVTAGMFATQDALERDPVLAARVLTVNFTNTVVFCEFARKMLLARGGGALCVFSSVAGERGRKPIVIYGASKAGLSQYLEGLDHKFRASGLRVLTVKPGFVHTGMTEGLKAPPFAGEPEDVARTVVHAIDAGKAVVYAPMPWAPIMAVIRALPRFVMRKVGF